MKLFALDSTKAFGEHVAQNLGMQLCSHEEREFPDGEHKARPLENVRGQDAYVIQSLYSEPGQSVNDKLVRLLFFLGALRDAGALRVSAVIPYFAYARKDRQTKARDPVTTRYMAEILEATGADAIVSADVHNVVAFQNAFRCHAWHLDTRRLFVKHLLSTLGDEDLIVASPDPGGIKRAQLFGETLEGEIGRPVGSAFMEKRRTSGVVSGTLLVGEVAGTTAIIVDDMIASGATMVRAAKALRDRGAKDVICVAAHGLFVGEADASVRRGEIDRWIISDTVQPFRLPPSLVSQRVEIVSAAPLFAAAISALHQNESLVALLAEKT